MKSRRKTTKLSVNHAECGSSYLYLRMHAIDFQTEKLTVIFGLHERERERERPLSVYLFGENAHLISLSPYLSGAGTNFSRWNRFGIVIELYSFIDSVWDGADEADDEGKPHWLHDDECMNAIPIKCVLRYISIAHFGNLNNFPRCVWDLSVDGKT